MNRKQIKKQYREQQEVVEDRLKSFRQLRNSSDRRKFQELVFVILTSQTSAKQAWKAAEKLNELKLLKDGSKKEIGQVLENFEIQYEQKKASYIVENRQLLSQPTLEKPEKELKLEQRIKTDDLESTRSWLAENMKGIGMKGASHFLRNIGYGNSFAIVSNHIITVLHELKLREKPDPPQNREEYLEVEETVQTLAEQLSIDVKALDLVLWSMKTGEVFK
ncbi:MAG: N-glycosylase [Candidatus Nanohaloarchaea archaeon]